PGLRSRVARDRLDALLAHAVVDARIAEEPGPAEDGREGRAQLVRDRREELVLHPIGLAQLPRPRVDELLELLGVEAQRLLLALDLAAEAAGVRRPPHRRRQLVGLDGLRDEVVRPRAERSHAELA